MWHCGYIDESEWSEKQLPNGIGDPRNIVSLKDVDVCPGYLVRHPAVQQAQEAGAALEKRSLDIYYPELENVILESAMLYASVWSAYESYIMRKSKEKHGNS
jgi:hypothetical protein